MTQNVRSAALAKRDEPPPGGVDAVKAQLRQNRSWFSTVVPKHIDADQFIALCLGAIKKGSEELVQALVGRPDTFLQAASECARMGLVPGETYHFVAFKNKQSGGGYAYEVTGMVDYKGEMDMIYRAGGVRSIHCHVVRLHDTFRWRPGEMEVPHHVIHAPDGSMQEGLASTEERGNITGVYAYCVMADGGYSQPTVMGISEIKRHRSFAKTEKFWGPIEGLYDLTLEGRHTVDMVRKTAIHKQYDMVPHSSEYVRERMRVMAEIEARPLVAVPASLAIEEAPDAIDAPVDPPGTSVPGEALSAPPAATPGGGTDEERRRIANSKLGVLFRMNDMGDARDSDTRRAVVSGLLGLTQLANVQGLSTQDVETAATLLDTAITDAAKRGDDVAAVLRADASAAAARIMKAQQDGAR